MRTLASRERRRRSVSFWIRRVLLATALGLVGLALTGLAYQAFGTVADARNYPAPGQFIDVGGYRLHLHCTGEKREGRPTVILETLSGGISSYWAWVQPELAEVTRVCSYDRAGRGWSEPSPHPPSARQTARDLHTLLETADVPGPYVLVGHSIGGLYTRTYAARFPDEVVGMVLLDASHPEFFVRDPEAYRLNQAFLRQSAVFPTLARLGLFRLYFALGGELDFQDLPPRQHAETAAFWASPHYLVSQRAENAAALDIYAEAEALPTLGDLPLTVVTAGSGSTAIWLDLQDDLAGLSSNSRHLMVADATHVSLAFNAKHARVTSKAILQVVAAVEAGQPLTAQVDSR